MVGKLVNKHSGRLDMDNLEDTGCDMRQSSFMDDQWQEMTFIPVYCGDMMQQLVASCSRTGRSAEAEREPGSPANHSCLPGSSAAATKPIAELATSSERGTSTHVHAASQQIQCSTPAVASAASRPWCVMDVSELPADCEADFGPSTPDEQQHDSWAVGFHSLTTLQQQNCHQQQQAQQPSTCKWTGSQFHSMYSLQPHHKTASHQGTAAVAVVASVGPGQLAGQYQHAASRQLQLDSLCKQLASAGCGLLTPRHDADDGVQQQPSPIESLDSLAVLHLHNPYDDRAANSKRCEVQASIFMGEF